MQGLILAEHEHQCSLHLFHRHRNRPIAESLTELPDPRLDRFRCMFHLSAFSLCRTHGLHAPRMFLICPVDTHQRRELGFLPQDFTF
jgi:hypothetical protein